MSERRAATKALIRHHKQIRFAPVLRSLTVAASMRRPAGVNTFSHDPSARLVADQREAHQRSAVFLSEKGFLPSPNRPASIRTLAGAARSGASWGSQSSTGAAISVPNSARPVPRTGSFRRDLAVTRTRRLAVHLPSSSSSSFRPLLGVAVSQRLVHLTAYPQSMQQHRQLPRHRHHGALLRILAATCRQLHSPTS